MEICERQELGLWLVLEDKKPVVAFPSKEQAEAYAPIHVAKREDVPVMEIVHISFRDAFEERLLHRPVRPPSVSPGGKPWLPPKLGPGVVPPGAAGDPIDISKFREAIERMKKIPSFEEYLKPGKTPGIYGGSNADWVGDPAFDRYVS